MNSIILEQLLIKPISMLFDRHKSEITLTIPILEDQRHYILFLCFDIEFLLVGILIQYFLHSLYCFRDILSNDNFCAESSRPLICIQTQGYRFILIY